MLENLTVSGKALGKRTAILWNNAKNTMDKMNTRTQKSEIDSFNFLDT